MKKNLGLYLFLVTMILIVFGIIMIYSSSSIWAEYKFNDAFNYVKNQALFAFIGTFLMIIISKIDYAHRAGHRNRRTVICGIDIE